MATAVADALSSQSHLVVEAGTGVGKSFAYLVPLLAWAADTGATVAVATSTIALQEQLVRKDLPLLAEALPFEVSFALVKGRANYLCLRRLGMAIEDAASLFDDDGPRAELEQIRAWANVTEEGSRQDLPFRPSAGVWDLARAEQGNCKGRSCGHYARCFYQRSRRQAHEARCLVLNHHVLMSDLALRRSGASFLPKVDAIVIDEAHDLEDTAAEHLGQRFTSLGTSTVLGRLWHGGRRRGLLARPGAEHLQREVLDARQVAKRFFGLLSAWAEQRASSGGLAPISDGFPLDDTLSPRLRDLAEGVGRLARHAEDLDASMELAARSRQLDAMAESLEDLVQPRDGEVRWIEQAGGYRVAVASAPVNVGELLPEVLWSQHDTVVLTSATLATGRPPSFAFLRDRLGLAEAAEVSVGSPFDYPKQVQVRVAPHLPDPVREGSAYEQALGPSVLEAVRLTQGGAFVLFTGYGAMRRVAEATTPELERDGLEVLVQGQGQERPALLARFREGGAVLFGVASFWQGVDVPGSALRHVIIARLPFDVPTHPLQVARQDRLKNEGKDPFRSLSLPVAALRLKQGFGRLIRRRDDEGVVTILDPRIVTRQYGRFLLSSLPACPVERLERPEIEPPPAPLPDDCPF